MTGAATDQLAELRAARDAATLRRDVACLESETRRLRHPAAHVALAAFAAVVAGLGGAGLILSLLAAIAITVRAVMH